MKDITSLILENEKLIYKIINKYSNYFDIDDLYQVAVMGMIKAYHNYKDEYNTKFISYAYPYILGEVIKYVNEFREIKSNKNINMLYSKIMKAREILAQKMMKNPSNNEIALFLGVDEGIIDEAIMANYNVESLDKIIKEDDKSFVLYEKIGYIDSEVNGYDLKYELEKLSLDELRIIRARYYDDMSQKEVGEKLGMYQVEISRKEKKILQKLKDNIAG